MADDKKNIPEAAPPTEAPAPAVENAVVPEQPAPEPALTDAEAVMLEHEGQAALFEMGDAVPDALQPFVVYPQRGRHPEICERPDHQYQGRGQGGRSVLDESGNAFVLRPDCLYHF